MSVLRPVFTLIFIGLASLSWAQNVPVKYTAATSPYKTITNARYGFGFDLPNAWHAVSVGENGAGFRMQIPDGPVDMRVYAEANLEPTLSYTTWLAGEEGQVYRFAFADGKRGHLVVRKEEVFFIRTAAKTRVVLYLRAPKPWLQDHLDVVHRMAQSLRFL